MPPLFLQRILYLVFFAMGWSAAIWVNGWSGETRRQIVRRGASRILMVGLVTLLVLVIAFQLQNGSMETPEWYSWMLFAVPFTALGAASRTLAHTRDKLRTLHSIDSIDAWPTA
jgi:hypothetical protein